MKFESLLSEDKERPKRQAIRDSKVAVLVRKETYTLVLSWVAAR